MPAENKKKRPRSSSSSSSTSSSSDSSSSDTSSCSSSTSSDSSSSSSSKSSGNEKTRSSENVPKVVKSSGDSNQCCENENGSEDLKTDDEIKVEAKNPVFLVKSQVVVVSQNFGKQVDDDGQKLRSCVSNSSDLLTGPSESSRSSRERLREFGSGDHEQPSRSSSPEVAPRYRRYWSRSRSPSPASDFGMSSRSKRSLNSENLKKPESPARTEVIVRNLSINVTKEHLLEIFSEFGHVQNVELNRRPGSPQLSSACITFQDESHAEYAICKMNHGEIDGKEIKVHFKPLKLPEPKTGKPSVQIIYRRRTPPPMPPKMMNSYGLSGHSHGSNNDRYYNPGRPERFGRPRNRSTERHQDRH